MSTAASWYIRARALTGSTDPPTLATLATAPAEEIQTVFDNLGGLSEVFSAVGLVLVLYGAIGWISYGDKSKSSAKGKQLFIFGVLFLAIGFNYNGFLQVIKYALGA